MPSSPSTAPAVELTNVSRLYSSFVVLRGLSLRVQPGAAILLLGENGAGKSTLLRLLAGLIAPSEGAVAIFGGKPRRQLHRLALMGHAPMLYDELTALENLRYFASLYTATPLRTGAPLYTGTDRPTPDPAQALRDVGLDPALPRRVADYSQGMRQRASLARVLMLSPDLLLLDEPFSNLDAASAQLMLDRLRVFLSQPGPTGVQRTLILTTHQADLARPLATTTLTLTAGRLSASNSLTPSISSPRA